MKNIVYYILQNIIFIPGLILLGVGLFCKEVILLPNSSALHDLFYFMVSLIQISLAVVMIKETKGI